jgi:hypothetical protein
MEGTAEPRNREGGNRKVEEMERGVRNHYLDTLGVVVSDAFLLIFEGPGEPLPERFVKRHGGLMGKEKLPGIEI